MGGPQQVLPEDQQQPTAGGNFYPTTGQILGAAAQGQYNQSTNDFGPSK
jgi:hypothetical protein